MCPGPNIFDNGIDGSGPVSPLVPVFHTVTAPELAAKQFLLPVAPPLPGNVVVDMHRGAPCLLNGVDFNIVGLVFDWNGFGLDGIIKVGDTIRLLY
ncbi:MAG: hypothetical protein SFU25_12080 [Candidatus Caenarcaniphilales bacterium]|nr:hypothetical protein [Candidatus Caenarcaniphilales bacterium]